MSDEFDKEAERERLKEKFEKDEADRAAAKQMSELLLQGARMTDRHCPTCGSPLFEEDDELFCPTCEQAVAESAPEEEPQPAPDEQSSDTTAVTVQDGSPREHLRTVIQRETAKAAASEDPRRTTEHLEAAKQAIEILSALGPGDDHSGA